jgi:hypothetical protein
MMCSKVSAFLLVVTSIIVASTGVASAQIVALGHSAVRGHVAAPYSFGSASLRIPSSRFFRYASMAEAMLSATILAISLPPLY